MTLTPPSIDEDVEQQELLIYAGGIQNCPATLEDSVAVCYKTKQTSPINPATVSPGIYPNGMKTVHTKQEQECLERLYVVQY